jgi:FkbM family methyltransferase
MLEREDVRVVYAFEAVPSLCARLEMNFGGSPRFRLIRGAIGNATGDVQFSVAADALGYSGLKGRDIAAVKHWSDVTVSLRRLDDILLTNDATDVGFIKLDLEGGEFDALRGARSILSQSRPLIVFENGLRTSAATYGYGWEDFGPFFDGLGYDVYDFFGNVVDAAYWSAVLQTYMFVGVPRESSIAEWRRQMLPSLVSDVLKRLDC